MALLTLSQLKTRICFNLGVVIELLCSGPSPSLSYASSVAAVGGEVLMSPAKLQSQTEPVDFSSSQAPPPPPSFAPPRPVFEPPAPALGSVFPPSSVRVGSPAQDQVEGGVARYRGPAPAPTSSYSSLPLSAVSPYDSLCPAYPAYQGPGTGYTSCLGSYPPAVSCFSSPAGYSPAADPQLQLSLAYSSAGLASAIPSPDSCLKPELG